MKKIKVRKDMEPKMRAIEKWTNGKRVFQNQDEDIVIEKEEELAKFKDFKISEDNRWDGPLTFGFDRNFLKCQKLAVEYYYCGFLQYYDYIVRSDMMDHVVYFKWVDKEEENRVSSQLTIYIWPAPIRKKISAVTPEEPKGNKEGSTTVPDKAQLSPLAPPPSGGDGDSLSSDPPTGPQPPPP
jgi:hypothetical protein